MTPSDDAPHLLSHEDDDYKKKSSVIILDNMRDIQNNRKLASLRRSAVSSALCSHLRGPDLEA
jgi:hypothetical protein